MSSQFLRKWNVELNEKVIEVEEETSILNPSQKVTTLQVRKFGKPSSSSSNQGQSQLPQMPKTEKNDHAATSCQKPSQLGHKLLHMAKNVLIIPD